MALTKASVLHYWSSRYGINPRIGGRPVFTRNSAGLFTTQEGEVDTAIVNTPRFDWSVLNLPTSLTERRKVLTLELARTNGFTYSNDLTNAAWTKTQSSALLNAMGPDSVVNSASTLTEDATAANSHYVYHSASPITTTVAQSASGYFKANGRSRFQFDLNCAGGDLALEVNLTAGTATPSATGGATLLSSGIIALGGGWYRAWISGTFAAATTTTLYLFLENAAGATTYSGDGASGMLFYGLQHEIDELFPTAVIPTTSPTATRATDSLYWNFPPVPQAMMVYVRFVEQGSVLGGTQCGVVNIGGGGTSATPPLFMFFNVPGNYSAYHETSAGVVSSALADAPTLGQTVELIGILFADGSVQAIQSLDGAAVTSSVQSGVRALGVTWAAPKLWANQYYTIYGANKFAEVKIVKYADVVASTAQGRMDEMRAFELGPNGDVL